MLIAVIGGQPNAVGLELINSCTLGGVTAANIVEGFDVSDGANIAIFAAHVPTGTTGTITWTYDGLNLASVCDLFIATGINTTPTAFHTAENADDVVSMSLNVPEGGIIVAGAHFTGTNALTTVGVTENADATVDGNRYGAGCAGPLAAETGRTVSFDGSAGDAYGVAASFAAKKSTPPFSRTQRFMRRAA
jgi:hypothetical protein